MRVPLSWLKKYVPVDMDPHQLARRLTMAGVEVGQVEVIGAHWDRDKVLVAQVLRVEPHPNADRLTLPVVDLGGGQTAQVVCGAPNIAPGQKVAFAKEGARLYNPRTGKLETLKAARIRGFVSRGMVCSERELGLGDDHEGILVLDDDAPVGAPLADYLGDAVLEVDITPNRPDCLSVLGVAHEVAALTGQQVAEPELVYPEEGPPAEDLARVEVADPQLCPRYTASLILGVRVGPSPRWLQNALLKAGLRPINNIVDVTNFVMLEYGQPMHAFDFDRLHQHTIIVRQARPGETTVTLDGETRRLSPPMLVIADARETVGLAGIMGSANSEIDETTTNVLLESANFDPVNTRRTRTALDMDTEASYRFERGLRPELAPRALRRATQLILQVAGGRAARGIIDRYPGKGPEPVVRISRARLRQVLGADIPMDRARQVLVSLGFREAPRPEGHILDLVEAAEAAPLPERQDVLWLHPPYWRSDIALEDDVVEEVARVLGYDQLPTTMLSAPIPHHDPDADRQVRERLRDLLAAAGLWETISYPLVGLDLLERVEALKGGPEPLRVANPMNRRQAHLRTTLRGSILETLARNQRVLHHQGLRLFEIGKVYLPRPRGDGMDLPLEKEYAVGVLSGPRFPLSWQAPRGDMDFFDAKGVLERVFEGLGAPLEFEPGEDVLMKPGKTARLLCEGRDVGVVGELHPWVLERFDLEDDIPVALFEVDLEALCAALRGRRRQYRPFPRYPEADRDVALVVDRQVPARRLRRVIEGHPLVVRAIPFDVYEGPGIPEGKRSIAFRVVLQSPRGTLTGEQVDAAMRQIVGRLERETGAQLRG